MRALYLPLALVPGVDPLILILDVVLGVITELAGIVVVPLGACRRYDGPLGKSDRAFAYGLLAMLTIRCRSCSSPCSASWR